MRRLFVFLLLAAPVWGETLFVDVNNPEGFTTIGEAINRADEGDEIIISEGFYAEQLTIEKNISQQFPVEIWVVDLQRVMRFSEIGFRRLFSGLFLFLSFS